MVAVLDDDAAANGDAEDADEKDDDDGRLPRLRFPESKDDDDDDFPAADP